MDLASPIQIPSVFPRGALSYTWCYYDSIFSVNGNGEIRVTGKL
jgi:hypothetical protein